MQYVESCRPHEDDRKEKEMVQLFQAKMMECLTPQLMSLIRDDVMEQLTAIVRPFKPVDSDDEESLKVRKQIMIF